MQLESVFNQLRTGYVPSPPEMERIQTDLHSLSHELARLEALILDFSAQRDKVNESIESRRALTAPVRRLPDDVVQEIFLACIATHRNAAMSPREAPLLLCRICSVWRALALATPMLWSSLHLHIGFILQREDRVHAVSQWLERSAACPLSLSITGATPTGYPQAPWIPQPAYPDRKRLFGVLLRSASRWHNIVLNDLPLLCAEELHGASAPLLQVLNIRDVEHITQWLPVISSPMIHRLSLEVVILEDYAPLLFPPLSRVTHLSISSNSTDPWLDRGIPSNVALDIIQNLTQLVSLKMNIKDLQPMANTITELPLLESLELRGLNITLPPFAHLIDKLLMPQLRHLALHAAGVVPQSETTNTPYFASLRKQSPLISSLDIDLNSLTADSMRQMLPNFPSLMTLVVRDSVPWGGQDVADTTHLLDFFADPRHASSFPALRAIRSTYSMNVEDQTLFRFLQSRVDAGGEFQLNLHYNSLGLSGLPDVERFRVEGLEILLTAEEQWVAPAPDAWTGLPFGSDSING